MRYFDDDVVSGLPQQVEAGDGERSSGRRVDGDVSNDPAPTGDAEGRGQGERAVAKRLVGLKSGGQEEAMLEWREDQVSS